MYIFLLIFFAFSYTDCFARDISSAEAEKLLLEKNNSLIVVDVRTPAEFAEGHLKYAKNIDFFGVNFESEAKKLPHDSAILLYCKSGKRSAAAEEILNKDGYTNLLNLKDGLDEWKRTGKAIEK